MSGPTLFTLGSTPITLAGSSSNMGGMTSIGVSEISSIGSGSDSITINSGTSIFFNTNSNERMRILPGGSIGIGTSNPQGNLHISSGISGDCVLILQADIDNIHDDDHPRIEFWQDGSKRESAIYHTDNRLNIANSVGGTAGIAFLTGETDDYTNAEQRMIIRPGGSIGINIDDPQRRLHIKDTGPVQNSVGNFIKFENVRGSCWNIGPDNNDTTQSEFFFLNESNKGARIEGNGSGLTPITFTGQHRNLMNTSIGTSQEGLIVSSTNKIINLDSSIFPTINESLPYCVLTNTDNDKKVFGVISSKEDIQNPREYISGNIISIFGRDIINEERMYINSLGEGAIWVCNKNGTLENGDYITSTNVPGYGGKQADPSLHNYTVAKITNDCDFSLTKIIKQKLRIIDTTSGKELVYDSNGDPELENDLDENGNVQMVYQYQTRFLEANGTLLLDQTDYEARLANGEAVYIACFVGCTYHCG